MASVRLQKVIAAGGVAARRKAEQLILEGRVTVNGKVVRELGTKVDPSRDRVSVDGEGVVAQDFFYVVFNKPKGCITAITDDRGRPTVMDYLPNVPIAVKPVGRLDFYTEGVLLLTNDGELAARLLASASGVPKTYHAKLRGTVSREDLTRLRQGVTLDDGTVTLPAEVSLLPAESKHAWVALTIVEGKQRQIHRMFESLGHEVQKLQRVAFANLTFHGLRVGDARELTQQELNELRGLVGLDNSAVARGVWESRREATDIPRRARAKARAEADEAQALAEQAQVARENRRALAANGEMSDDTDPAAWMADDIESSPDSWGADEDEDGDRLMPVAPTRDFGVAARGGRSRFSHDRGGAGGRGGIRSYENAVGAGRSGRGSYDGGGSAARGGVGRRGGAGPRGGGRSAERGAGGGGRGSYDGGGSAARGGAGPRGGGRSAERGAGSGGRSTRTAEGRGPRRGR